MNNTHDDDDIHHTLWNTDDILLWKGESEEERLQKKDIFIIQPQKSRLSSKYTHARVASVSVLASTHKYIYVWEHFFC